MGSRTRLGMMLPGAVSLGAYEGGALAAILTAVQAAEGELAVDAIASASAGSITALVASRALLTGADPFKLMVATWVELPGLGNLKTHSPIAPLSMEHLEKTAQHLLGTGTVPDGGPGVHRQDVEIRLSMALTALGGLDYRLPALSDNDGPHTALPVQAGTNLDWFSPTFAPGAGATEFLAAMNGALASGSTPVGFPPRLLDRRDDKDEYEDRGVVNPTDDWHFWYSDGGDIDNEPFGRLLDLIEEAKSDPDDRAIVMLQTDPPGATRDPRWFDPDPEHTPTWTSTLLRVNHIRQSQNYYDDLRRLEKTNSRLTWVQLAATALEQRLEALTEMLGEADREAAKAETRAVLDEVAATIRADQETLRAAAAPDRHARPAPAEEEVTVLSVLQQATGLHGKRRAVVEIISPDIDPSDHRPAADKLAGEFLFHFGGFLDERFRRNDFDLGCRNAITWLTSWLPGRVTDPERVLRAVNAAYEARGWTSADAGDASLRSLSLKEDAQVAGLAAHIVHVLEYGLRHDLGGS